MMSRNGCNRAQRRKNDSGQSESLDQFNHENLLISIHFAERITSSYDTERKHILTPKL
jgi:hypothetical protein